MRYTDSFSCCGEHWIINIPVQWAIDNPGEFDEAVNRFLQVKRDHQLCMLIAEVKAFFVPSNIGESRHGF